MAHHLSQQPQNPSEPPALVLPSAPLQHRSSSITSLAAHQHHQRSSPLKQLMQQQAERSSSAFWALSPGSGSKPLVHSDRFIPSRTSSARLDFSVLERELVTSDVSRNAADREVRAEHRRAGWQRAPARRRCGPHTQAAGCAPGKQASSTGLAYLHMRVCLRAPVQDIDPAYHLLLRSELLGAASGPIPADKAQQLQQLRSPCRYTHDLVVVVVVALADRTGKGRLLRSGMARRDRIARSKLAPAERAPPACATAAPAARPRACSAT